MSDLRPTIIAKSDQTNADDLLSGPMTIKITGVSVKMDEQPVAISFEGDNNKPYKPGKSMRRVLVNVWGPDGNKYIGRSLTLYRDDKVQFGGLAVGGIRISHMSDIPKDVTMALTVSRANKKPFVVRPLVVETKPEAKARPAAPAARLAPAEDDPEDVKLADDLVALFGEAPDLDAHAELVSANEPQFAWLKENAPRLWKSRVEPAVKASEERHTAKPEAPAQEAATDALLDATLDMVRQIGARNKDTLPALTVSGKYQRFVGDLEKSGRLDLMNRIRDANASAILREPVNA